MQEGAPVPETGAPFLVIGIAVKRPQSQFHPGLGVERTAEILVERLGFHALDFATRQAELLANTGAAASVEHWRLVAQAIEKLLLGTIDGRSH